MTGRNHIHLVHRSAVPFAVVPGTEPVLDIDQSAASTNDGTVARALHGDLGDLPPDVGVIAPATPTATGAPPDVGILEVQCPGSAAEEWAKDRQKEVGANHSSIPSLRPIAAALGAHASVPYQPQTKRTLDADGRPRA